jgi:hypothetical protein
VGIPTQEPIHHHSPRPEDLTRQQHERIQECSELVTGIVTTDGSSTLFDETYTLHLQRRERTRFASAQVVEAVFVRLAPILELVVNGRLISTTGEHPFYAWQRGWVPANELHRGDTLLTLDGGWATVEKVVETGKWERVYNLRVAEYHTYFVGCDQWGFSVWAHNACVVELDAVKDAVEIAANGGKRFKIVEGSKTIGYHADRPTAEKWLDLASDPAVGKLRPDEAATAQRVEQSQGVALKRYNPPAGKKGDWVDSSGVVYDGVSPAPSAHFAKQWDNWKASLADHIVKVDKAVVDLTGKGLTPAQTQQVIDYINALPAAEKAKVILLK